MAVSSLRRFALGLLLSLGVGARATLPAYAFRAGVYAPAKSDSTCIAGVAGSTFETCVWVWAPPREGIVYVTLRLAFPAGIERRTAPDFHEQVVDVIYTDYADGTSEWNLILSGCPAGWARVFCQKLTIVDESPCRIGIRGADSWIRDCDFELHRVDVDSELRINDPECDITSAVKGRWGTLKMIYNSIER